MIDSFVPVTGADLPDAFFRDDVAALRTADCSAGLDRHLAQLLILHPKLGIRFRKQSLQSMDHNSKLDLLNDINDALGITPLLK